MVRRSGEGVDFKQAGAFDQIAARCIELLEQAEPDLDLIILDEMQDMQPEWVMAMLSRLKAQGKAVLLEDPEQQLYKDRIAFDLPDAVSVTSHENFRTPRALVKIINRLRLTTEEVEAMSPFEGEMPDPIIYESAEKIAPLHRRGGGAVPSAWVRTFRHCRGQHARTRTFCAAGLGQVGAVVIESLYRPV
jgi:adenine deaminase